MINVVKIGGNVIDNPEALEKFLREFASLEGDKILVHGGGKEATRMSESMGVPTTMIEGRRVTDRATLNIVTMLRIIYHIAPNLYDVYHFKSVNGLLVGDCI